MLSTTHTHFYAMKEWSSSNYSLSSAGEESESGDEIDREDDSEVRREQAAAAGPSAAAALSPRAHLRRKQPRPQAQPSLQVDDDTQAEVEGRNAAREELSEGAGPRGAGREGGSPGRRGGRRGTPNTPGSEQRRRRRAAGVRLALKYLYSSNGHTQAVVTDAFLRNHSPVSSAYELCNNLRVPPHLQCLASAWMTRRT